LTRTFRLPGDLFACACGLITVAKETIEAAVSTDEHMPPHNFGGRAMLISGGRCNNSAETNF